jgi:molecular chaperone GrpE
MKKNNPKDENKESEIIAKLQLALENESSAKMRAIADLDNFRRRETEQRIRWSEMAVSDFLKNILSNFLELELLSQNTEDENAKKIVEKFFQDLKKNGVEKIAPQQNDEFNENLHEILLVEPVKSGKSGKIARTLEPGWRIGDTILRVAKIAVVK